MNKTIKPMDATKTETPAQCVKFMLLNKYIDWRNSGISYETLLKTGFGNFNTEILYKIPITLN